MKVLNRFGPFVLGVILVMLIFTVDLLLVSATSIILTVTSGIAALSHYSVAQKGKRVFDSGDYTTNRSVDVTSENHVPPPVLRPAILELNTLGFRRLGEEATVTAEDRVLGTEWTFAHVDGQMIANLCPVRAVRNGYLAGFQTIFDTPAWIITYYPSGFPMGETITQPDLRLRHSNRTLRHAYELHQAEVAEFSQQHGAPVPLHTMTDYLAFAPIFRERHMGATLRRGLQVQRFQSYFWFGMAGLFLIGTLLSTITPALAIVLLVVGYSTICLDLSYTVIMLPPRPTALFRWFVLLLALVLLPLELTYHAIVMGHILLLAVALTLLNRYVPTDVKALVEEISSDKPDINWQS